MTQIELGNKYREIFVNKVSDSIATVDLWLDKTRDCYQHINILFANNKLLYTGARTYVFGQNIHDIFTFFNVEKFDLCYWKEKCEAASEPIIITEVNEAKAREVVDKFLHEKFPEEYEEDKIFGIQNDIDTCFYDWNENEFIAAYRISELVKEIARSHRRNIDEQIDDFLEQLIRDCKTFDRHFVYCCEVIQWVANNLDKWLS